MAKCVRLGVGAAAAAVASVVGGALWLASEATVGVYPPLPGEAPSGLFADGFGLIALGFGVLVTVSVRLVPRLGRVVRTPGARLGVGVGCVLGIGVGLWALGIGVMIPVLMWPGALGAFWALVLGVSGAVLLGASVTGLCRVIRRRGGRAQTHFNG